MPAFHGDGLIFEETLPVAWSAAPLPAAAEMVRLNADNQQLLGAESTLDDGRMPEALKDESPALVHELQRLEYKLNIVLRLIADLHLREHGLPPRRPIRLSSVGLEWFGGDAPSGSGLLKVYLNDSLPHALKIPSVVAGTRRQGDTEVTQLRFSGMSEAVVALLDKFIFRHHRRMVAGAKLAAP